MASFMRTKKRGSVRLLLAVGVALAASGALAWNFDDFWQYKVTDPRPGGGGNFATGSKSDRGLTCNNCHIGGAGTVGLAFTWSPQLLTLNGKPAYQPGVRYTVNVALTGEHLAVGATGQINNFAAVFEDVNGNPIGVVESDSGQKYGGPCPANITNSAALDAGTTTIATGDCRHVYSRGRLHTNATSWKFFWTAPPASSAATQLHVFWGVVDGNDKENSLDDDAKTGELVIEPG